MLRTTCLLILATTAVPADDLFVDVTFEAGLARAAEAKKVVFVDFFTTWCAPCKKLDAVTWADADVRAWLSEATVPLKIDAEKERALAERYGVSAFPTLLFLKPDGTELDRLVGFRNPEAFLDQGRRILHGETVLDGLRKQLAEGGATDVELRLDLGRELARRGRSAEALAHFLWVYDEGLEHNPAYGGVRNSFLLGDIRRLGRGYPPAIEALRTRRDERVAAITAGKAGFQEAMDVAALNRTLKADRLTLQVYESLADHEAYDPAARKRMRFAMYRDVVDVLLEERRYADLLAGVDDPVAAVEWEIKRIDQHQAMARHRQESPDPDDPTTRALRRNAVAHGGKTYEALLGTGQLASAATVRDLLLELDASYPTYKTLVRHAVRAETPEEVETLLARAAPTLSEKEGERLTREARRKPR